MAGIIKLNYPAATTAVTVTNLHSLASSATWIAGWTSNSVTNTTNEYSDYMVSGTFTTHASNRQAGAINIYILAALNDTPTWTAASSGTIGTEGALAFADTYRRDSLARLLWSIQVDNTASAIYTFPPLAIAPLFNHRCPTHWAIFVAQNAATTTAAGLASSGSAIYYTPIEDQYT